MIEASGILQSQYAEKACASAYIDERSERTVEQNIDAKIYALKQEIIRLEESKKNLHQLLGIKLRDLREAANY